MSTSTDFKRVRVREEDPIKYEENKTTEPLDKLISGSDEIKKNTFRASLVGKILEILGEQDLTYMSKQDKANEISDAIIKHPNFHVENAIKIVNDPLFKDGVVKLINDSGIKIEDAINQAINTTVFNYLKISLLFDKKPWSAGKDPRQITEDPLCISYLKLMVGVNEFDAGKFDESDIKTAFEDVSEFYNKNGDNAGLRFDSTYGAVLSKEARINANAKVSKKDERTKFIEKNIEKTKMYLNALVRALESTPKNELHQVYLGFDRDLPQKLPPIKEPIINYGGLEDIVGGYADLNELAKGGDYVEDCLKKMRRENPSFSNLVERYIDLDEVDEEGGGDYGSDQENDPFSQPDDDYSQPIPREERVSTETTPVEPTSEETSMATDLEDETMVVEGPDFSIQKKQFELLSIKIENMLNACKTKFTAGANLFSTTVLINEITVIHSDISDKISKNLSDIHKSFFDQTAQIFSISDTDPVFKLGVRSEKGVIIQKYEISLGLVGWIGSAFANLNKVYGQVSKSGNVIYVDLCVETLSKLLNASAALGSQVHMTKFMVSNNQYVFLKSIPLGTPNEEGLVAVKGVDSIASIFDPYNTINVSIKTTGPRPVEVLSLTCSSNIEEKIQIFKEIFTNSQPPPPEDVSPPPGDSSSSLSPPSPPPTVGTCGDFNFLLLAADGKIGEFLEICALHGLKFTTLLQKAGDSQMPIQVGTENLLKMYSNAINCFMDVYKFVAWWCHNTDAIKSRAETKGLQKEWVDNVAKELLSLLFKFIQFYGEHFLINKFTFSKGRENLCAASENYAPDLEPDSLVSEAMVGPPTQLYENAKNIGIFSYDEFAKEANKGHIQDDYHRLLTREDLAIADEKKILRQGIKDHKTRHGLKGGGPKTKTGGPTPQEQLEQLEQKLEIIKSSEKPRVKMAELHDDAANFIGIEKELPWDTFKKYMENYIVNFCKEGQPSLKMISFLKMMHLNALMVRLGWGFIDLAGGSLMNFLKRRFVVTADYDSKIYFLTKDEFGNDLPPEEIIRRQTYIKMCMINLGMEINNYMIDNGFFKDAEIKAQFSFKPPSGEPGAPGEMDVAAEEVVQPLDLLTVLLELPNGRWFSSRGKEPDLFPVPLYSSDMFWSVKLLWVDRTRITPESKIFKSDGFAMSIGYEDLVFKHLDKHFLYKALIVSGVAHDEAMQTIYSTFVSPYNFDAADASLSKMNTSRWFALRIPSLYEIECDIESMLTEPELKNARMAVGKNQKDVDRLKLVSVLKDLISQLHDVDTANQKSFFMRYPIASTFANKILLYFQTDLFQVCCKRVDAGDVKMLLPPLGIISNGTNALNDDDKNGFLLPPLNIANTPGAVVAARAGDPAPLELTQLMRRAVLYSYNTTSNIFMTIVHLTKKYGEFKSGADFERLQHIQQFDFNVIASGIGFSLFNYELWVSRGKLQSPIPFENCYVAGLNDARDGLTYNDAGYQGKRAALHDYMTLPQFAQLVSGVQAPDGAPAPLRDGVVDRAFVVGDRVPIKNTTAETIAAKIESTKLNPLYGTLQNSIAAATEVPSGPLIPRLLGDPSNAPISVYGGGKRRLTKKRARRTSSLSSLLLFTKRNRPRSLKQKKRTIKKGLRKKRNGKGKSLKK
jgi:hypothetical protein